MGLRIAGGKRSNNRLRPVRDSGVILVETAIVLLFLSLLSGGILEYGSLYASAIDNSAAVRSGARTGASPSPTGPTSDYEVLQSVSAQLKGNRKDVQRLVIWKASTAHEAPPDACLNSPLNITVSQCDIYDASAFSESEAELANSNAAKGWPNSGRQPDNDYLGLWIQYKHHRLFGMVPAPSSTQDHVAVLIEKAAVNPADNNWKSNPPGSPPKDQNEWFCLDGKCVNRNCTENCGGNGGNGKGGSA